jgi:serine/threonine protein kinase
MKQCKSEYVVQYFGSYFKDNFLWVRIFLCFILLTALTPSPTDWYVAKRLHLPKLPTFSLVMEYCAGGSVCDIMNILDVNLNEDQIAVVMHYVLNGLHYLHSQQRKIRMFSPNSHPPRQVWR